MQQVQGTSRPAVYPNSFFKASKFPLQSAELELSGVEARRLLASKQGDQPPRCSLPPVALLWRCCLISDILKVKTFEESVFGQKISIDICYKVCNENANIFWQKIENDLQKWIYIQNTIFTFLQNMQTTQLINHTELTQFESVISIQYF